jgi:hypothetical protein
VDRVQHNLLILGCLGFTHRRGKERGVLVLRYLHRTKPFTKEYTYGWRSTQEIGNHHHITL